MATFSLIRSTSVLFCLGLGAQAAEVLLATEPTRHRFSLSGETLLGMKVHFKAATTPAPGKDGDPFVLHQYGDGFVGPDGTSNLGGRSGYYDFSSDAQVSLTDDTFSVHTAAPTTSSYVPSSSKSQPTGVGFRYQWVAQIHERTSWGLEAGPSFLPFKEQNGGVLTRNFRLVTDRYDLGAPPDIEVDPRPANGHIPHYLPSPGDPRIGAAPNLRISGGVIGAGRSVAFSRGTLTGVRELSSDMWIGRFGPWVETAITKKLSVGGHCGIAVGEMTSDFKYSETINFPLEHLNLSYAANKHNTKWLAGLYAGAEIRYQLSRRWGVWGRADAATLGKTSITAADRRVDVDLRSLLVLGAGLSFSF